MKIKKSQLYYLCPFFFLISMILMKYYVNGDQTVYIKLYNQLKVTEFFNVMNVAHNYSKSYEPISAYLLWLGAKIGFKKIIYISIMNTLLLSGIFLVLKKNNIPWYLIFLILTNFYTIVLITGAEKLKFAYIILVYAFLFKRKIGIMLAMLSPLAHLQSFIILISLISGNFIKVFNIIKIKKANVLIYFSAIVILIFFIMIFHEGIIYKIRSYLTLGDIQNILKILLLLIIGLIITKKYTKLFFSFLPIIMLTYFFGDLRINMITLTILFYLLLIENRLTHPLSILLFLYFSIKSCPFIYNIFKYGNGFDGWLI